MNAILKDALKRFDLLSPEDQEKLAREIDRRVYDAWLEGEIAKGEASGGEIPMDEVFDRIAAKHGG